MVPPEEATGEVPLTPVTVPVFEVLLLNVFQSVLVKAPVVEAFAVSIEIVGAVALPPELIGEVPLTPVTVPVFVVKFASLSNILKPIASILLFASALPSNTISSSVPTKVPAVENSDKSKVIPVAVESKPVPIVTSVKSKLRAIVPPAPVRVAPPSKPVAVVISTLVIVPVFDVLLLKVVKFVDVKYPLTLVEAAAIEIVGEVPPEEATGAVPETPVTVPVFDVLLLKVVQSVLVKYPLTLVVAAAIEIVGEVPPEEATGEVPLTPVTVPVFEVLLLNVFQSVLVKAPVVVELAVSIEIVGAVALPPELIGEVPLTPVTVPVFDVLLLNVVKFAAVKYPLTVVEAAAIEIVGVVPPEEATGDVPETDVTVPPPIVGNVVKSPAPSIYCVELPAKSKAKDAAVVEFVTVTSKASPVVVAATEVTVPVFDVLLLKVVKAVDVKYPLTLVEAAAIEIVGEVPPEEATGEVPLTPVTVPVLDVLLLKVVQSVPVKAPVVEALAVAIEIVGEVPPEEAIGVVPLTPVTVPAFVVKPASLLNMLNPITFAAFFFSALPSNTINSSVPTKVPAVPNSDKSKLRFIVPPAPVRVVPPSKPAAVVISTLVIVPAFEVLLLKVFQSVLVKAPVVEASAVSIEIVGAVALPPELIGEVPLTPVTVPVFDVLLLKVVKFAAVKYPLTVVEAAAIEIVGEVPPEEATGAVPETPVTVPVFDVLLLKVVQSCAC